ncbi:copper resistance protein CopC [Streptomyces sp. NPDC006798]|uniref:copper resistance CopC/CopD family protein n=1 Tax=Streptomyces sp. NPDC006798 TaxID=3155462 RepID=UPI00340FD5B8
MTTTTAPHPPPVRRTRPAGPLRALLAAVVLVGTVLSALLAAAGPAAAHAALTGSDPKDGAVVATAPAEVTLTFSEQLAMGDGSIRVLGPNGSRADSGPVRDRSADGRVAYSVGLRAGLPDGTYTVAWQAVSADSHPISGAFTFSVGAPSATTVALPDGEAGGGTVGVLYDIARYVSYAGFVLLCGAAAFVLVCWPRGASVRSVQRLITRSWLVLTAATVAMLMLRVPYTGSGKLADVFDLGGLQDVLASKTGAALVSRLLLLGAAALFVAVLIGAYGQRVRRHEAPVPAPGGEPHPVDDRREDLAFGLRVGGAVVCAGIAATWALSEHASTGIQTGLAIPLDVLHLLAVAGWLGGLAALLTALRREPSLEPSAVRRFSGVALGCVVVLAATGLYQSWRQIGSWSALTGTPYGRLLLVKVALVVLMVAVARWSRRWTARLEAAAAAREPRHSECSRCLEARAAEEFARTPEAGGADDVPEPAGAPAAAGPDPGADDPVRAAQLARQRAAVASTARRKARDADPVRSGLRRSVLVETGIAAVVLAVTTVLTATEPARTAETADRAATTAGSSPAPSGTRTPAPAEVEIPFDTGGTDGRGTIRLGLDPAGQGPNGLRLRVTGPDGGPLDVPEVRISLTLPAQEIGPLAVTPVRTAPGEWSADAVRIPMAGDWRIRVTVRTSDIDQTSVDQNMKIG